MSNIEQQKEHFESVAEQYFTARQNPTHLLLKQLIWQDFSQKNIHHFKDYVDVLEPMCGYSEGKDIIEKYFLSHFNYTGFDYSDSLIKKAIERDPLANVFVQDVTTFNSDILYDGIILIGGLHHVYHHVDLSMERLVSALKPGGFFINLEPTQNNCVLKKIREKIYKDNELFDDDTEQAFDLDELNTIFSRSGLSLVDQSYPGLLAYVLYYNPDAFPLLNKGGEKMLRALFLAEKKFYRGFLAKKFSFATLSLLIKN